METWKKCAIAAGVVGGAVVAKRLLCAPSCSCDGLMPIGGSGIKNMAAYCMMASSNKKALKNSPLRGDQVDARRPKSDVPYFNDSIVFCGVDEKEHFFIIRMGCRSESTEVWVNLVGPDCGHVVVEEVVSANTDGTFESNGLKMEVIDPATEWKLTYAGNAVDKKTGATKHIEFELTYVATTKWYHSCFVNDAWTSAQYLAEMPWSEKYFNELKKEAGAGRAEQGGVITGDFVIDSKVHPLRLYAVRDRSWGRRDWSYIDHYIWNYFYLSEPVIIDGKEYKHGMVTAVKYGNVFDHVVGGWIAGPDSCLPISRCSHLNDIGGFGTDHTHAPSTYDVTIAVKGSCRKPADANIRQKSGDFGTDVRTPCCSPYTYITLHFTRKNADEMQWRMPEKENHMLTVNEAFCSFTCGNVKGVGMAEFGYRPSKQ